MPSDWEFHVAVMLGNSATWQRAVVKWEQSPARDADVVVSVKDEDGVQVAI